MFLKKEMKYTVFASVLLTCYLTTVLSFLSTKNQFKISRSGCDVFNPQFLIETSRLPLSAPNNITVYNSQKQHLTDKLKLIQLPAFNLGDLVSSF